MPDSDTDSQSIESVAQQAMAVRPSWWRVLASPWIGIWRPRWAGGVMARSGAMAVCAAALMNLLIIISTVVVVGLWGEASIDARQTMAGNLTSEDFETRIGAAINIWSQWGQRRPHQGLVVMGFAAAATVACALLLTWIMLPTQLNGRRILPSFFRTLRTVMSGAGLLAASILLQGVFLIECQRITIAGYAVGVYSSIWQMMPMVAVPASIWLVIGWVMRAAGGVIVPHEEDSLPLRCEKCGYDLTHQAGSGVCTECGAAVALSVGPEPLRSGCSWERHRSWLPSALSALFRPSQFYERAMMKSGDLAARRFARRHFLLIGVGAWCWSMGLIVLAPNAVVEDKVLIAVPLMAAEMAVLCGLIVRGVVGSLPAVLWAKTGYFGHPRWAGVVIGYETAFLWVFCAWNGLVLTISAFGLSSGGVGTRIARNMTGLPWEAAAVLCGNAALMLVWLQRYRTIGRAVRWANF